MADQFPQEIKKTPLLSRLKNPEQQHVEPTDTSVEIGKKQTGSTQWGTEDIQAASEAFGGKKIEPPDDIKTLLEKQKRAGIGGNPELTAEERNRLIGWNESLRK